MTFYLLALGSMLAYAVQHTLLVHHARKMDGLSLAFYRNISFVVTLLPLLLGADEQNLKILFAHWPLLLGAAFSGGAYLAIVFAGFRYLNVSFANTISVSVYTLATVALGWILLGEHMPFIGTILIAVILVGVLYFGIQQEGVVKKNKDLWFGIFLAALCGIPLAYTKYAVAALSRLSNPFVSGYFWELGIGLAAGILLLLRFIFTKKRIEKISGKHFLQIAACSSPTLIGTGLYCMAVERGPIAIVGAIGAGSLVACTLLAHAWYGERITNKQWLAIGLIIIGVAGLKFV